jgi:SAM-dependent methyltransferase
METVHIGIPRERTIFPPFFDNFMSILASLREAGMDAGYFVADGHRVDRNRDAIVKNFLEREDEADWLLMLDTDMEHPTNIAQRLTRHKEPIVGGLYFHRTMSTPFCFRKVGTVTDDYGREIESWRPMREEVYEFLKWSTVPRQSGSLGIDFDEDEKPPYGPLLECDAVATGALLIHRDVLEKMPKPVFEYQMQGISEDLQFCYNAQKEGFKIHCDLSTISGHYHIDPQGFDQFMTKWERLGQQVAYWTPEQAAEALVEFYDMPLKKAEGILAKSSGSEVKYVWNKKPPTTPAEELTFYKKKETGEQYVIELIIWNNSANFVLIKNYISLIRGNKILEIGSGIGTVAIQLALQNNDVTAVEINKHLRDFTKWRIEDSDRRTLEPFASKKIDLIEDVEWWDKVEPSSFDVAVSFDVFEHMPEDILKANLKGLARALKPNGRLIYHANFGQQDSFPMHHDYSEQWEEWFSEAGFAQINNFEALLYKKE